MRSPWPRSRASATQRRRRGRESGRSSCLASSDYLYDVKMWLQQRPLTVKQNLYDVNIRPYKVLDGQKDRDNPTPRPPGREAAAKAPAKTPQQPSRRAGASDDTPYHHGALRDALLEAAERVLEGGGLAGLTFR